MNLETKITIYKFTPQVFTLTPDATVCVARCVRTHFTNRGMCQNVDNAVFWFVGARFSFYTLPCCKKDLDVFQKDGDVS